MALATVLWTLAGALGVAGLLDDTRRLMFCAIMAGLVATTATVHMLVEHAVRSQRICLERLVDGMVTRARERVEAESELTRLRR